eukprot:7377764-Prymnesium_polylepis.1
MRRRGRPPCHRDAAVARVRTRPAPEEDGAHRQRRAEPSGRGVRRATTWRRRRLRSARLRRRRPMSR